MGYTSIMARPDMVMHAEGKFSKEQIQGDMLRQRIYTEPEGIPTIWMDLLYQSFSKQQIIQKQL
jgi:hypothetical protein